MANSNPMDMAASAKEQIQTSARELMRNLEQAMTTTSKNEGDDSQTQPATLQDRAASIESAFRKMFVSCTSPSTETRSNTGSSNPLKQSVSMVRKTQIPQAPGTTETPKGQPKFGEHIYAQLFYDDQVVGERGIKTRAEKAVHNLRETKARPLAEAPRSELPKPFPASSPHRAAPRPTGPTVVHASTVQISSNLTFDDGISAISAHTLEAMAQHTGGGRIRSDVSKQSTQDSLFSAEDDRRQVLGAAPFGPPMTRTSTWGSKNTRNSGRTTKNSHSTRTTESSNSFEAWHKQEQEYWQGLAEQPHERASPTSSARKERLRRHQAKLQKSRTTSQSTATSTIPTTYWQGPKKHPHDTTPFVAHQVFSSSEFEKVRSDPDRIGRVLVLSDGAEVGEI